MNRAPLTHTSRLRLLSDALIPVPGRRPRSSPLTLVVPPPWRLPSVTALQPAAPAARYPPRWRFRWEALAAGACTDSCARRSAPAAGQQRALGCPAPQGGRLQRGRRVQAIPSAILRAPACASMRPPTHAAKAAARSRRLAVATFAMVNVDFASPSLVLGTALIGCGVVLLQARNMRQRVSRDADIVVAAMISIVGSTLIFQGWRLDPLLLLCQVRPAAAGAQQQQQRAGRAATQGAGARCKQRPATARAPCAGAGSTRLLLPPPPPSQALTTSVAFWYGMETFKLRSQLDEAAAQPPQQLPPPDGMAPGYPGQEQQPGAAAYGAQANRPMLPQADQRQAPWQQAAAPLFSQQEADYAASSSAGGRWGPDPRAQQGYDATIRWDAQRATGGCGGRLPPCLWPVMWSTAGLAEACCLAPAVCVPSQDTPLPRQETPRACLCACVQWPRPAAL